MKDDSSLNPGSPKKSGVDRAKTLFSDSFRLAASVMGSNTGSSRAQHLNLPNLQLIDKAQYKKQPECQICYCGFGKLNRQHHCRICANAVCSSCSLSTINKERACDKCAYHYSDPEREKFKQETLTTLTTLCVHYLGNKLLAEQELKNLQQEVPSQQDKEIEKKVAEERIKKMNDQLQELRMVCRQLQDEIESIRSN